MKYIFLPIIFLFYSSILFAQNNNTSTDTLQNSFFKTFRKGSFNGNVRYFFMTTSNIGSLKDFNANALGGTLRYHTTNFHRCKFEIGADIVSNVGSSDFFIADSSTGQFSRYESGLFDITNLDKKIITRLQQLNVSYQYKNTLIKVGQQLINTPFINTQDGRMTPTAVSGVWAQFKKPKHFIIEVGWIDRISPRSTSKWYKVENSFGIYSSGINSDGTKSNYFGNIQSKGIGLLGFDATINKKINISCWNVYTENVSNTFLFQLDFKHSYSNNSIFFASAQCIKQDAMNNGGNTDATKTYFNKRQKSFTYGGRLGLKNKRYETSINYNRITADSRFLMPREWGREPFFTYLTRERNEGTGDTHSFLAKIDFQQDKIRLKTSLGAGYYLLPDVHNYRLNKYGLPSYFQFNFNVKYNLPGVFRKWEAQFLLADKIKKGNSYNNDKFVINKVDLIQCNFILNYNF